MNHETFNSSLKTQPIFNNSTVVLLFCLAVNYPAFQLLNKISYIKGSGVNAHVCKFPNRKPMLAVKVKIAY